MWHVGAGGDNKLRGYDGDTGMAIFDGGGEQLPAVDRFQTPIAVQGRIFVVAESGFYAFTVN